MNNIIEQIRELDKKVFSDWDLLSVGRRDGKKAALATKLADKADKLLEALEEINQYECIEGHDTIAEQAIKDFKDGE